MAKDLLKLALGQYDYPKLWMMKGQIEQQLGELMELRELIEVVLCGTNVVLDKMRSFLSKALRCM